MPDSSNHHVWQALSQYALKNPKVTPIRHNENITCRVEDNGHTYVLRIHRPVEGVTFHLLHSEYSPAELMCGELDLLLHLARSAPFPLQTPVPTKSGQKICVLPDNTPACLLTWVNGEPLTQDISPENARALGKLAAQLHRAADGFSGIRPSYSPDLLQRIAPEFLRAKISDSQMQICLNALEAIRLIMTELQRIPTANTLIHADLGLGNILVTPDGFAPIDFSLSGYGSRAQECGMLATNFNDASVQKAIFDSYAQESGVSLDARHLDGFFALSVLLFIASQHTRYENEEWFAQSMSRWCGGCLARVIG